MRDLQLSFVSGADKHTISVSVVFDKGEDALRFNEAMVELLKGVIEDRMAEASADEQDVKPSELLTDRTGYKR